MMAATTGHQSCFSLFPSDDQHNFPELPVSGLVHDPIHNGQESFLPNLKFHQSRSERPFMMMTISLNEVDDRVGLFLIECPLLFFQSVDDHLIPFPNPLANRYGSVAHLLIIRQDPVIIRH